MMPRVFRDSMDYVDAAAAAEWEAIEADIAKDWLDPVAGTAGRKAAYLVTLGAAIQRHVPEQVPRFIQAVNRGVNRAVGEARAAVRAGEEAAARAAAAALQSDPTEQVKIASDLLQGGRDFL